MGPKASVYVYAGVEHYNWDNHSGFCSKEKIHSFLGELFDMSNIFNRNIVITYWLIFILLDKKTSRNGTETG